MKGVALWYLLRGLVGLIGAGVCTALVLASLLGGTMGTPTGWLIGGAMLLLTDAIISFIKCRTIGKFR
ncbi:MAG TPA: hypothetical protein VGO11_21560 [Chthoniobacteraceae bacterium]|nr:hypothetical protein [Chthoniobacteraceae bacterium]